MQTFIDGIKLAKEKYIEQQMSFNQQDSKKSKEFTNTNEKNVEICDENFVSLQKILTSYNNLITTTLSD